MVAFVRLSVALLLVIGLGMVVRNTYLKYSESKTTIAQSRRLLSDGVVVPYVTVCFGRETLEQEHIDTFEEVWDDERIPTQIPIFYQRGTMSIDQGYL